MEEKNRENIVKIEGIFSQGFGIISKLVNRDKRLTPEAKAIYAYIVSFAGNGMSAFPSVGLMCDELPMSPSRFYRHRKLLVDYNYIAITREQNENIYGRNIYTIVLNPDENCVENTKKAKIVPDFEEAEQAEQVEQAEQAEQVKQELKAYAQEKSIGKAPIAKAYGLIAHQIEDMLAKASQNKMKFHGKLWSKNETVHAINMLNIHNIDQIADNLVRQNIENVKGYIIGCIYNMAEANTIETPNNMTIQIIAEEKKRKETEYKKQIDIEEKRNRILSNESTKSKYVNFQKAMLRDIKEETQSTKEDYLQARYALEEALISIGYTMADIGED